MTNETPLAADSTTDETPSPAKKAAPAAGRKGAAVEVLYSHPMEPDLTWSGRGRKPRRVEVWLDKGGTLEGLLTRKRPKHRPRNGVIEMKEKTLATEIYPRCDKTLELQL